MRKWSKRGQICQGGGPFICYHPELSAELEVVSLLIFVELLHRPVAVIFPVHCKEQQHLSKIRICTYALRLKEKLNSFKAFRMEIDPVLHSKSVCQK